MTDIKKKPKSAPERWVSIYPAYINSKRTLKEGRRIPASEAVEEPTVKEIFDILQTSNYAPVAERKMYPRDQTLDWVKQGRVRVQLYNDDGSLKFPDLASKRALYAHVAAMIPKLKSRQPGFVASTEQAAGSSGKKNKKKK
ncbi:unnamed protein product, partial [Mesorhabditis spiculigera]